MIGELPTTRTKLPLLKVRGGMHVELVSLAEKPLGFHVHWLGTRSYMCPGVDCAACFAAVGARWLGMLPIRYRSGKSDETYTAVLELTAGTYERLIGLSKMSGFTSLLGLSCIASRSRDRASLRVEPIEDLDVLSDRQSVFPIWLLLDGVATLYGLPTCSEGDSLDVWESAALPKAAQLIRTALPRVVS